MLKAPNRLVREREFAAIYKKGQRRSTKNLNLIFLKINQNNSRFGFVVSKKQAGRIVDRNRIKRRLRAHVSRLFPLLSGTFEAVISGKRSVLELNNSALGKEVEELLKKARMLKNS